MDTTITVVVHCVNSQPHMTTYIAVGREWLAVHKDRWSTVVLPWDYKETEVLVNNIPPLVQQHS